MVPGQVGQPRGGHLGTAHYGRLSGLLAAPATIASSLAPFAGAAPAGSLGGYTGLFAGSHWSPP